jgi:hypothetical protein
MSHETDDQLTNEEVAGSYRQFANRIADIEDGLVTDVPTETTADIPAALEKPAQAIETQRRTARTVPVLNVYRRVTGEPIPDRLVSALTALDVIINATDDIVDTQPLSDRDCVTFSSNILFGHLYLFSALDSAETSVQTLAEYYTAVAQIPQVERRLQRRLADAGSRQEAVATAGAVYEYDSVDIEGFVLLSATEFDHDPETTATLLEEFRTFRARHLLYEDIRHVERTISQGDTNPVMYFIDKYDSVSAIADAVRDVLSRFEYSGTGEYVSVLQSFERAPDDLEALIRRQVATR